MFKSSMLRVLILAVAVATPVAQTAFAQQQQQAAINGQFISSSTALSAVSPYNTPQPAVGD